VVGTANRPVSPQVWELAGRLVLHLVPEARPGAELYIGGTVDPDSAKRGLQLARDAGLLMSDQDTLTHLAASTRVQARTAPIGPLPAPVVPDVEELEPPDPPEVTGPMVVDLNHGLGGRGQ